MLLDSTIIRSYAATARTHGVTFATAEKHFWQDEVQEMRDGAKYDRY